MNTDTPTTIETEAKAPPLVPALEIKSDVEREYIGSSAEYPWLVVDRILPQTIDDAERDFGEAIYDQMLNEAVLGSHHEALKVMILSRGFKPVPSIDKPREGDPESPDYDQAKETAEFCERCLKNLRKPLDIVLWDMLDAMAKGHRMAEIIVRMEEEGEDAGKLVLDRLKPKPRKNFAFVLNSFNDLRGVIANVPGVSNRIQQGLLYDIKAADNVLPPSRFFILSFGSVDDDPRGKSFYRKAYDPWLQKQMAKPENLKFLAQFGGGMITGVVGEGAQTQIVGNKEVSAVSQMTATLSKLKNGGVAAFSAGSQVTVHVPNAEGKPFQAHYERCDREMVLAVMKQVRATMEAQHGSKADSETGQDVLDVIVDWLHSTVCEQFKRQVLWYLVMLNWGVAHANKYTPDLAKTAVARPDLAKTLPAMAACGYAFDPSQFPDLDEYNGFARRLQNTVAEVAPEVGAPFHFTNRRQPTQKDFVKFTHATKAKLEGISEDLAAGTITDEEWATKFYNILVDAHADAYLLGKRRAGNLDALTDEERASVITRADIEDVHLQDFLDAIKAGDSRYVDEEGIRVDGVQYRSRMYLGKLRYTANQAFVESSGGDEEFDWVEGAVEHCDECPELAAMSPWTKDTLWTYPGGCDTPCKHRCHCHLKRRDGVTGFKLVDGIYDDPG